MVQSPSIALLFFLLPVKRISVRSKKCDRSSTDQEYILSCTPPKIHWLFVEAIDVRERRNGIENHRNAEARKTEDQEDYDFPPD